MLKLRSAKPPNTTSCWLSTHSGSNAPLRVLVSRRPAPGVRGPSRRPDGDQLGEPVPAHQPGLGQVPEEPRGPGQVLACEAQPPGRPTNHARLQEVERLELVGPLPFDHHAAPPTGQAL